MAASVTGCYGRNGHEDAAADAALIAREVGKPVRVQWSRAGEHGWDPKGPPTLLDYRAAVDAAGNLVAWESEVFIPEKPKAIAVTLVAGELADVTVNRRTGKIKVDKFYMAHDCGQIINPDGLKNQIEGNVVQTISRTLFEDLQYDRSTVTSLDWASYPIPTFPDVPEIVTDLIDRPDEPPWGAGEPTAAVVPSAISNAVFDATGKRLRSVPFTPQKMLEALQAT